MGFDAAAIVRSLTASGYGNVPPWAQAAYRQHDRHIEVMGEHSHDADEWERIELQARSVTSRYTQRRCVEHEIADYLESKVLPCASSRALKIPQLVESLRTCRCSGVLGTVNDRIVIMWDAKCDNTRLCPDQSRIEHRRMIARYKPPIMAARHSGLRIYKAVFTMPNFERGKLKYGMQKIYRRLASLKRATHRRKRLFPEIVGMLSILESPLSASGGWNVHLNVFLIVDGWLDYQKLRRWWHWQVEVVDWPRMRAVTAARMIRAGRSPGELSDDEILDSALDECIKYPLQTVAEKSGVIGRPAGASDDGSDATQNGTVSVGAPPLTEWPPDAFLEWWSAYKGFRRSRAYGKLYNTEKPAPEPSPEGVEWLGCVRFDGAMYQIELPARLDLITWGISPQRNEPGNGDFGARAGPGPGRWTV